ncbi:MAG: type II toxin-antitoxin system HicB family antitoxin [Gloeobacterales cyanobacterium]
MSISKYQMLIQWSDEDHCYVVSMPDFHELNQPCTDGATYEEAAKKGQELIESLFIWYQEEGKEMPQPKTLQTV